jgi:single-strand DNA-binding protein
MSNTHVGTILEIRETKNVTDKFQKRQFVVDQVFTGQYGESHNPVVFSLVQEKCGLIDEYKVGEKVVVHFDLDGRPWIDRDTKEHKRDKDGELAYFCDHRAWKIEPVVQQGQEDEESDPSYPVPEGDPMAGDLSVVEDKPKQGAPPPSQPVDEFPPDDLPLRVYSNVNTLT